MATVKSDKGDKIGKYFSKRFTRRQGIKVGSLSALGLVFHKPLIHTIRPTPAFALTPTQTDLECVKSVTKPSFLNLELTAVPAGSPSAFAQVVVKDDVVLKTLANFHLNDSFSVGNGVAPFVKNDVKISVIHGGIELVHDLRVHVSCSKPIFIGKEHTKDGFTFTIRNFTLSFV